MKLLKLLVVIFALATLSSCTTAPLVVSSMPPAPVYKPPPEIIMRHDITHVVAPGETLWRISKTYDVTIENIMYANGLGSNTIEMGQSLLIPRAMPATPVISLYPTNKWKYIIIHHSATDVGNALSFYNSHKRRGFIKGLGYHFVIDNGSSGKPDGYIEISPRWIKQENGAHCKAGSMNYNGIGICLVGNFSKERVSQRQLTSLVYLVDILRKYYKIPIRDILGHGSVPGARTECPGSNFPWKQFLNRLK